MTQFWRFLLAGGAAAAANYGSRFLFSLWVPYEPAIVLAFFVGLSVGFLLMRGFVFDARHGELVPQVIKYVAINFLALLQTLVVSIALARWLLPRIGLSAQAHSLGHLAGVLVPIVSSYFGHRLATFR
jgi:putative flippase GtrA